MELLGIRLHLNQGPAIVFDIFRVVFFNVLLEFCRREQLFEAAIGVEHVVFVVP